ncbi:MAG: Gfo/Idh/MocA family protein [Thermoguttaceae bacterium]|jgi:predicted dehydrogenase
MKKMGFGIIGCGMIAGFHAKAIAAAGGELIGCYDKLPLAAERIAKENGGTPYQNLGELLADPAIDIVTIGTPSGAHMDPAVMAAEAGKHVIVEKPLEVTLERCDKIIAACDKAGVTLSTIFPSRFHPSSTQLKKAIESGRFGKLTLGDAIVKWYRTQEYYDSGHWRGTWALDGGGALMNQAIHSVDLLLWLMGPVAELTAMTGLLAHERIEVEDTAVASLRFKNGALGTIEATTAAYPGYLKRIEIHGNTGSAVIEEEDIIKWDFAESKDEDAAIRESMAGKLSGGGGAADPAAISYKPHAKQFANVMQAIETGTKPLIDGHEGRRSVEVITGIYEAAKTGRPVTFA